MPAQSRDTGGGLSVQTLVIASMASLTAAIVVHEVWQGGAILGAAITPVIVAIVSEGLRKPTQRLSAIREERTSRQRAATRVHPEGEVRGEPSLTARRPAAPPPPEFERPDPFGIWQDDKRSWRDRIGGRHLKIALVTGLLAFGAAVVVLTTTELVFGGNVGGGSGGTTVFGGSKKKDRDEDPSRTTTTPAEEEQPQEQAPPGTTTPPAETTPQEAPPAQTTPAPTPEQPAPEGGTPAPTPEAPAPQTP